jgi:hypothetical protein
MMNKLDNTIAEPPSGTGDPRIGLIINWLCLEGYDTAEINQIILKMSRTNIDSNIQRN